MVTRFPLDQPMDVNKFRDISIKACEEYIKREERIKQARSDTNHYIWDEERRVQEIIRNKAELTSKVSCSMVYIISALFYLFVMLCVFMRYDIDYSQYSVGYVVFAFIFIIILTSFAPIIWLVALHRADSTVAKVIWGLIIFGTGIWTFATIIAFISFILSLINSKDRWQKRFNRMKKYKRMLRRAKSRDSAASDEYQANASARLKTFESVEGEYDWLYYEWARKCKSLINDINTTQRRSPCVKYWSYTSYAKCVDSIVKSGPSYNITLGKYETPYRYMDLTIEHVQEFFNKFALDALDREFRKSLQKIQF